MRRKVIQLAGKTLVVSLPIEWVKKYGVKKSDEVELTEKHNTLLISTSGSLAMPERASVSLAGIPLEYAKSILSVLHKVGYDEIELFFDNLEMKSLILERVQELIGFEVIDQSEKRCVMKNVSGDDSQELSNMVRRTFFVISSLASGSFELCKKVKSVRVDELLFLEKTTNRLTNYCHRLLNKHTRGSQTTFLYIILWLLESIGDCFRDIVKAVSGRASPLNEELLGMFGEVVEHIEKYHKFFYSSSMTEMTVLREENQALKRKLSNRQIVSSDEELSVLIALSKIVQYVHDCFGSTTGKKFLEEHVRQNAFS